MTCYDHTANGENEIALPSSKSSINVFHRSRPILTEQYPAAIAEKPVRTVVRSSMKYPSG